MSFFKERDKLIPVGILVALVLIVVQNVALSYIDAKRVKPVAFYKNESYETCIKSQSRKITQITPDELANCVKLARELHQ